MIRKARTGKPPGPSGAALIALRKWSLACVSPLLLVLTVATAAAASLAPSIEGESPRVQALLEQAWSVESGGRGQPSNTRLAAALYAEAGFLGSGEGYYRAALIDLPGRHPVVRDGRDACLLIAASHLGHQQAAAVLERSGPYQPAIGTDCSEDLRSSSMLAYFSLERHVEQLSTPRREVVSLIRKLAPRYAVDSYLALAMASVESNFNARAISPKMAMGVMQLIPATAERFGVVNPFDPEQNIRGGLAYLRWLKKYYQGDVVRMVAAYNAGEKAVDSYGGIPPYPETVAYVARVLYFSGVGLHPGLERGVPPVARHSRRVVAKPVAN